MELAIKIAEALIAGIPRLIEKIKASKNLSDIKLGDFLSTDALESIRKSNAKADDFIANG